MSTIQSKALYRSRLHTALDHLNRLHTNMPPQLSLEARHRIVTLHRDAQASTTEIARRVQCTPQAVRKILRQYRDTGDVTPRARPGRPRLIADEADRAFHQILSAQPTSTSAELARALQHRSGVAVSSRTARRHRREIGWHPAHFRMQPELEVGHFEARLRWANANRNRDWARMIFTDEKKYVIDKSGLVHWVPPHGRRRTAGISLTKHQVTVFGAFWTTNRAALHVIRGRVNTESYINIVQETLHPHMQEIRGFDFVHDKATWAHTRRFHQWATEHQLTCRDDYPSRSPDLNPIETLWARVNAIVQKTNPRDTTQLQEAVTNAWMGLPVTELSNLITHQNSVIEDVIGSEGGFSSS
jgi:transposase